jgi:predicted TIM-barrel fold metal-dependent hydrolase
MHFWAPSEGSPHSPAVVGACQAPYLPSHYAQQWSCVQYVVVEALPLHPLQEVDWVRTQCKAPLAGIVAQCALQEKDVEQQLAALKERQEVVGIRYILNYHPKDKFRIWNNLESDLLENEAFVQGLALLDKYQLCFDAQLNLTQVARLERLMETGTVSRVVLNHLLLLQLDPTAPQQDIQLFKIQLQKLARYPELYMKISMLTHVYQDQVAWWISDSPLYRPTLDLIHWTITTLGPDRCMLG